MRTTKQPETDMLLDLKRAVLDALLLRIRHGEISTEELIRLYLSFKP